MSITKVGIVYSKSQQVVRRIIKLHVGIVAGEPNRVLPRHLRDAIDEDVEFQHHKCVMHPNEAWADIPIEIYDAFTEHQHIHDHLGLTGISAVTDRCMVVDGNGVVVAVGCWDPWIDRHPAGRIIPHGAAVAGGTFINGIYNAPAGLLVYSCDRMKTLAVYA